MNCNDSSRIWCPGSDFSSPLQSYHPIFISRREALDLLLPPNKETCCRMTRQSHLQRRHPYIHTAARFGLW